MSVEDDLDELETYLRDNDGSSEFRSSSTRANESAVAALDRLAAAIPRWMPISEAPKDGTDVLCLCENGYRTTCRYIDAMGYWICAGINQQVPTHFQPLPAAPGKAL